MSGDRDPGTVAVLPVKRLATAKQRLRGVLGQEAVAALVHAMALDVLDALSSTAEIGTTLVVTAEPAIAAAGRTAGARVLDDPAEPGHSEAAWLGIGEAGRLGARAALIVPGDCPLLSPGELEDLLSLVRPSGSDPRTHPEPAAACIVPDRHGAGTNALLLRPPRAMRPAFGPGSFERHRALATDAGAAVLISRPAGLALDLDTPDDLAELGAALRSNPDRAPATAAALQALGVPTVGAGG